MTKNSSPTRERGLSLETLEKIEKELTHVITLNPAG